MTNNKIKIDLSGIENLQDPYYEVEVKIDKDTKIVFPRALVRGECRKKYHEDDEIFYRDNNNRMLLKKINKTLEVISGGFELYPTSVDGVLYKEIREVRNNDSI